jgi:pyruvate formate lyase activating enzyme
MTSGMIFDIKRYAINDGPGIRTAVFMKGCPLDCWWCHNPEGQSYEPQLMFRSNRCKSSRACLAVCPVGAISWNNGPKTNWQLCNHCGKCADACYSGAYEMVGREVSVEQLMAEIERDVPFYDQSGGGVTFTGGEPLFQMDFLREALQACKSKKIHTTVDTSGFANWRRLETIVPFVDLFLYDIKLMDTRKHFQYTAVPNKQILGNIEKLASKNKCLIVRLPLIPGINDDEDNLKQFGSFLSSMDHLEGVEVMPYHTIGMAKFQALGREYRLANTPSPTLEQITHVEELLSSYGLQLVKHPAGRTL